MAVISSSAESTEPFNAQRSPVTRGGVLLSIGASGQIDMSAAEAVRLVTQVSTVLAQMSIRVVPVAV